MRRSLWPAWMETTTYARWWWNRKDRCGSQPRSVSADRATLVPPGLVLLAYQPDSVLDEILPSDKLEAFTVWSVTDAADYRRRLYSIREHGYAIEKGEAFPDVTALAAPIFDHQGKVVAAAAIVAPTHRVPDDRVGVLLNKLIEATCRISRELGASQVTPVAVFYQIINWKHMLFNELHTAEMLLTTQVGPPGS